MTPSTPKVTPFQQVTIVGVGLLGCSLGLALRARGLAEEVVGVGRREASLNIALERGAIHRFTTDLQEGARAADLVVIATPAGAVCGALDVVRESGAIVTDVSSTKRAICAHAARTWPRPRRFIGSHPMAGSEQYGPEHGSASLYENSICLVERADDLDPHAQGVVLRLWEQVGARVVEVDPEQHDAILARTSHLPHILASIVAEIAGAEGDIRPFIGNGFRDVTRIAAGRPEIWRDICLTNREALLSSLEDAGTALQRFRRALEAEDAAALEALFAAGVAAREQAVRA